MREHHDPIESIRKLILDSGKFSEEAFKAVDKEIKEVVNASAEFAQQSPEPDPVRALDRCAAVGRITMSIQILMPALSPTMTEGKLTKWLKNEGDKVKPGQVIAEIETDKATMEVEAVDEGVIGKILVAAGTEGLLLMRHRDIA